MSPMSGSDDRPSDPPRSHAAGLPYLSQHEREGAWVVAVHGAFDSNSTPSLSAALEAGAASFSKVVVDAAGLTFADSTVLNVLLTFNRTAAARLYVARPAPPLRRVLELTGADTVLDIRPTLEDALAR
ncbi:STAS domain-containing protein [Streptomyces sp. SS7]|uniref:STAS domain-containing protein n=1 Tax=Streptomyces sp. SS7 TaxID=3108485 RepID=UPI0030EC10DF